MNVSRIRTRTAMALGLVAAALVATQAPSPEVQPEHGPRVVPTASGSAFGTWCTDQSDIAVFGSSSETGYRLADYANEDGLYAPTRYGWVSKIGRSAQGQYGTTVRAYARNGAVSADFLSGGRWPLTVTAAADMAARGTDDLVLMDMGVNDAGTGVTPAQFAANLTQIIHDIRAARPGIDILLIVHWTISTLPTPWADYAREIRNVAIANQAGLVDLRQDIESSAVDQAGLWDTDRYHLNAAGHSVVAARVWSWLAASC